MEGNLLMARLTNDQNVHCLPWYLDDDGLP